MPVRARALELVEIAGVDVSGLAVDGLQGDEGSMTIERLAARHVLVRAGSSSFEVSNAVLTGVVARLRRPADGIRDRRLECSVQEVRVDRLDAVVPWMAGRASAPTETLRLDAIDEVEGLLRAFVTDALWFVDAEVIVPVVGGKIDFNRIDVNHIGPDSVLGLGPTGVYVEAPHGARRQLIDFDSAPLTSARGVLDLRALIEALLRASPDQPFARVADPRLLRPLQRTRLSGELRLGDGLLGSATGHVVLAGREQERNRVDIASPAVAQEIALRIPQLAASSAAFTSTGAALSSSSLAATLEARVVARASSPGASTALVLELALSNATLRDARLESTVPPSPAGGVPEQRA